MCAPWSRASAVRNKRRGAGAIAFATALRPEKAGYLIKMRRDMVAP
jgi:hypothetical protein